MLGYATQRPATTSLSVLPNEGNERVSGEPKVPIKIEIGCWEGKEDDVGILKFKLRCVIPLQIREDSNGA
ncbi:hypothetical protein HJFPF1_06914 [Paramyrothecium foliicola]|nr:hypothetical protein HJFPF1_06914 [Paramyrothecium foliicola]